MSTRPLPATGSAAAEDELLAQLGLPASASPEDLDNLHDAVSAYLAAAPSGIRGWAHAQAAALDVAYLSLTDPVGLEGSALMSPTRPPAVVPGGPATPPVRRDSVPAAVPVAAAVVADDAADGLDDEDDTDDEIDLEPGDEPDAEDLAALYASVTPSAHEDMAPARTARPTKKDRREARRQVAAVAAVPAAAPPAAPNVWKRIVIGGGAVIAIVAIALGANALVNGFSGGGTPAATAPAVAEATPPAIDQAKVADLMAKYQADPSDTATLLALSDEFYAGQQFDVAGQWLDKVLAIDPKSVQGLLARGAVYFNLDDPVNAEKLWQSVVAIDPKNQEVYYDLGFLALNQQNPDWAGVQRNWNKVIELDPTSTLATTVKSHLDSLVASSMIPGPSQTPATSPGASAAPSGSPAANVLQQTAKDLAFGTSQLAAPADTPFTIHFDNQDSLPHDIVIKDASGAEVFKGELVTGPKAVDYAVPALKAGAYTFNCSIHPNMTGTLTVGS
jgi:plastocyanin/cytochrome c-type biogenesis protein CcmH/NrfG